MISFSTSVNIQVLLEKIKKGEYDKSLQLLQKMEKSNYLVDQLIHTSSCGIGKENDKQHFGFLQKAFEMLGEKKNALACKYDLLVKFNKEKKIEDFLSLVVECIKENSLSVALDLLERASKISSSHQQQEKISRLRGKLLIQVGRSVDSIPFLLRSIQKKDEIVVQKSQTLTPPTKAHKRARKAEKELKNLIKRRAN